MNHIYKPRDRRTRNIKKSEVFQTVHIHASTNLVKSIELECGLFLH